LSSGGCSVSRLSNASAAASPFAGTPSSRVGNNFLNLSAIEFTVGPSME